MKFDKLMGESSRFPLEHKILNTILLLGILLSAVSGFFNIALNIGPLMIMVCIFSIMAGIVLYYISVVKKQYTIAAFLVVFIIIFILTPIMWVFNGGIQGGTALYILIFSSMISTLFRGTKRISALVCLVLMSLALMLLEYKNPSLITGYSSNAARYADISISLISTLISNAFLSVIILNHYKKENKRAREYFAQVEKQKMEKEIARLDRLNLIGEMAASIGHEVRNPMTTVRGFIQLFQRNHIFSDYGEQLKVMVNELDRANAIISEFLSLAKDKLINLQIDSLNRIVTHIYPLLEADALLLGKQLTIDLGDIPELLLDENEIRQCILNFVRNSYEATGDEGVVTLKTYVDGEKVVLEVKDNGTGILPEVYEKLGTPFVTTKPQGTGLGIPVCYRVAERHNAEIHVETSSMGTTVALRFNHL